MFKSILYNISDISRGGIFLKVTRVPGEKTLTYCNSMANFIIKFFKEHLAMGGVKLTI